VIPRRAEKRILLTVHRRESHKDKLGSVFRAVRKIAEDHPDFEVLYPMHKSPTVRREAVRLLSGMPRIIMTEPLSVFDFHEAMRGSYLVITDSGGVSEEAAALGVPALIVRDKTEREESLRSGSQILASTDTQKIISAFRRIVGSEALYNKMKESKNPFGDGHAAERIANILGGLNNV